MKRVLLLIIVLAAAASAGFFLYSRYRPRTPQNVILITIDTLRADHMSVYGYKRDTSPEIARRAKDAIVFERALVQWPKTVPSMVSMFSSTYPHTNGILFASRGQYVEDRLVMLPEILKQNGFTT